MGLVGTGAEERGAWDRLVRRLLRCQRLEGISTGADNSASAISLATPYTELVESGDPPDGHLTVISVGNLTQ